MDVQNIAQTDAIIKRRFVVITMPPFIRKLVLTAHIIFSVGWLGAVLVYVALAIAGLASSDSRMVSVIYPSLELAGWYIIVPCSLAALLSGLIQSLGTPWGLFRYYWVLVKFLLTFVASIILVNHMPVVSEMARMVTKGTLSGPSFERLQIQLLVHAGGGLLILIFTTVLSVYKPWGKTVYGIHREPKQSPQRWKQYALFGLACLTVLFIAIHLLMGGMRGHH